MEYLKKLKAQPKRFIWPDFLRGLAIYLVIIIHVSPTLTDNNFLEQIITAFTRISVPLFVMVSGALLLGKSEGYKEFFKKRVSKVLIPWIGWTVISMITVISFQNQPVQSLSEWVQFFHVTFLTRYWFIPMLFTLYLLTPLLRIFIKHAKKSDLWYGIVIWFCFIGLFPTIENFFRIDLFGEANIFLQYSGYFILGYVCSTLKLSSKQEKISIVIFIFALFLTLFFGALDNGRMRDYFYSFLSTTVILQTVSFFLVARSLLLRYDQSIPQTTKKVITNIGSASLGIYFVHEIVRNFLLRVTSFQSFMQNMQTVTQGIVLSFIVFIISFFIVFLLQKIPMVKKIVS